MTTDYRKDFKEPAMSFEPKGQVCPPLGSAEYMRLLDIETPEQLYRHIELARANGYE